MSDRDYYDANPHYKQLMTLELFEKELMGGLDLSGLHTVQDIGCGNGDFLRAFSSKYKPEYSVYIDFSRMRLPSPATLPGNFEIACGDWLKEAYPDPDCTFMFDFLEHVIVPENYTLTNSRYFFGSIPINMPGKGHINCPVNVEEAITLAESVVGCKVWYKVINTGFYDYFLFKKMEQVNVLTFLMN